MKQYICDKCKKLIEGTTYYVVSIYGRDINPSMDGRVSLDTAAQEIDNFFKNRCFCEACKNKIEAFVDKEEKE